MLAAQPQWGFNEADTDLDSHLNFGTWNGVTEVHR